MRNKLFAFLLVLALCFPLFGAANGTNYNCTTAVKTAPGYVQYYGNFTTAATDCVGTFYTKSMHVGSLTNYGNAYSYLVCSNDAGGTEDVNVYVEYSFDKKTWALGSLGSGVIKDQLSTTAVIDTINVQNAVHDPYYAIFPYMRLKFIGQTGNPIGTTITWKVKFFKDPDWPPQLIFAAVENSL